MAIWLPTELPLFRRELTELAQRRRTYVVRVIGAIVLLSIVMLAVVSMSSLRVAAGMGLPGARASWTDILGTGGQVFEVMVPLLFIMVPIILPALCCSAISSEKEQNTFGTLLLTRLSPSTIILEKLLSRIVPMYTLLLLVSPVLAYAYSLGGVDPGMMFGAIWMLFCECILYASVALFFSAWFPSTVLALIWSYIVSLLLMYFGLGLTAFGQWNAILGFAGLFGGMRGPVNVTASGELFLSLFYRSAIPLAVAAIVLGCTRIIIVRRAFVGHASFLMGVFRRLDQFFKNLNQWTTGGIEVSRESKTLPDDDPITWRERSKKSLGQVRWLVRVLLALEGPTAIVCALVVIMGSGIYAALYPLQILLWTFALILAAVKGASLFSHERSRQTLEPLLATPLTSREMLQQKIEGTNRLLAVLACPLLTVNLSMAFLRSFAGATAIAYLALSCLLTLVILRTVIWFSAAIGVRVHSPTRAITFSIAVVGIWTMMPLIPVVVLMLFSEAYGLPWNGYAILASALSAPGTITGLEVLLQQGHLPYDFYQYYAGVPYPGGYSFRTVSAWQVVLPGAAVLLVSLFIVRSLVLSLAPRLLQRLDKPRRPSQ